MIYMMYLCAGITWAGCGVITRVEFPNEAACYRSLAAIRINDQPVAESDKRRSMFAYCYPKPPETKP